MVLTDSWVDAQFEYGEPLGYDEVIVPEIVEGRTIYVARHPALPRCLAQGDTPEQARAALAEVREEYLADMLAVGIHVAPPRSYPKSEVLEVETASTRSSVTETPRVAWRVIAGDVRITQI